MVKYVSKNQISLISEQINQLKSDLPSTMDKVAKKKLSKQIDKLRKQVKNLEIQREAFSKETDSTKKSEAINEWIEEYGWIPYTIDAGYPGIEPGTSWVDSMEGVVDAPVISPKPYNEKPTQKKNFEFKKETKTKTNFVKPKSTNQLFVKDLKIGTSGDDLLKFLNQQRLGFIYVKVYHNTDKNKTTGFVTFKDQDKIEKCLSLNGRHFLGLPLRIERCEKK
jgi:hypothetical protein